MDAAAGNHIYIEVGSHDAEQAGPGPQHVVFIEERGESPDKPFSGKFNSRLDPDLHQQLYIKAKQCGLSLNQWVTEAIQHHLQESHA